MRTKSLAGVLIALLMMAGAAAASAQEVTQAEKDKALQYLESTKKNVLEATKGLSEAQWNFKAGPDRWSVAQVVEHIAASEDFIRGMVVEKVMTATTGLRDHVMDSPLGKLDGYEFVLFIAAHSERHTKQINEVKADPNFPKK